MAWPKSGVGSLITCTMPKKRVGAAPMTCATVNCGRNKTNPHSQSAARFEIRARIARCLGTSA